MSRSARERFLTILFMATAAACTSATTPVGQRGSPALSASSVITEEELAREGASTAYLTIQRLRPHFLSMARARGSTGERVVYVDGARLGTVEVLHRIRSNGIREVRYLDAREATIRFGTGHSEGAILIVTKTGRNGVRVEYHRSAAAAAER